MQLQRIERAGGAVPVFTAWWPDAASAETDSECDDAARVLFEPRKGRGPARVRNCFRGVCPPLSAYPPSHPIHTSAAGGVGPGPGGVWPAAVRRRGGK